MTPAQPTPITLLDEMSKLEGVLDAQDVEFDDDPTDDELDDDAVWLIP